jgi:hypothetical protein
LEAVINTNQKLARTMTGQTVESTKLHRKNLECRRMLRTLEKIPEREEAAEQMFKLPEPEQATSADKKLVCRDLPDWTIDSRTAYKLTDAEFVFAALPE